MKGPPLTWSVTFATTMQASSTPFVHGCTYSTLGNITAVSTTGSYIYAGTNYANPHAATSFNGTTLTYDTNSNLTAYGSNSYTWD